MVLIAHILIALLSIAAASYTFFRPSKFALRASYVLIASTLISGTYLVVSTHSAILPACTSGLFYTLAVSLGIIPARRKLARETNKK